MKIDQVILDYRLQKKLGETGYGSVWTAEHVVHGFRVVVKTFVCFTTFLHERHAMSEVSGFAGIVRIIDHSTEVVGWAGVLVLQFYEGGDLFTLISSKDYTGDEAIVRPLFVSIAHSVRRCHEQRIVHLDINPENIVFDLNSSPVLINFSHARDASLYLLETATGSRQYQAPETMHCVPYNGFSADIYSLGATLFVMRMRMTPPSGNRDLPVLQSDPERFWARGYYSGKNVSAGLKDLIGKMMKVDPAERPTINEVLCHPWITG